MEAITQFTLTRFNTILIVLTLNLLVLTSTNRGCWLFAHLTILVFIDCFYSSLDLVYMTCRPILYIFLNFIFIVKFLRFCVCGIHSFRFIGLLFLVRGLC